MLGSLEDTDEGELRAKIEAACEEVAHDLSVGAFLNHLHPVREMSRSIADTCCDDEDGRFRRARLLWIANRCDFEHPFYSDRSEFIRPHDMDERIIARAFCGRNYSDLFTKLRTILHEGPADFWKNLFGVNRPAEASGEWSRCFAVFEELEVALCAHENAY